ncbi:MAG: Ig-like domain-containing protein [Ruminococcus sp.]|nr:Ig-like domain-containing protein [Ruminococcus sp.]
MVKKIASFLTAAAMTAGLAASEGGVLLSTLTAEAATTYASITASSATVAAGGTCTVTLTMKNNPGVVSWRTILDYDSSAMEITNFSGSGFTGGIFSGILTGDLTDDPFSFSWADAGTTNNTYNGTIATITFKVKETAAAGTYALKLSGDAEDYFDADLNNVSFNYVNGSITVTAATVAATGVSVSPTSVTLNKIGDTQTLTPTVTPSNASNKNVTYSSSNTSVATVSSSGVVTAVAPGTADITVKTADGGYTAVCKVTVPAQDISGYTATLGATSYVYDGNAKTPSVTVKNGSTTLVNGTDYTVAYSNNTEIGTATVTITGKGKYTGKITKTFAITAIPMSSCTVTLKATSFTYTGTAKNPGLTVTYGGTTLVKGTDYTVAYSNNINPGTATCTVTGIGKYTGTKSVNYTIKDASKTDISKATATLGATSFVYTGTAKNPSVKLAYSGTTLKKGTDYTVEYKNNINAGTASVVITGIGKYTGTKTVNYTIKRRNVANFTITLSKTSFAYTGTAKNPSVTVKYGSYTLKKGTDYKVAYTNNVEKGTATVTITGKGNFGGTLSANYTIK